MKTHKIIAIIISPVLLLASCEKENKIPGDIPELSTDSLKILQAIIPEDLYTDLTFINETTGYAISNAGSIVKTTDCGYNWEQLTSDVNFFLSRIQFTDTQTGFIIGGDNTGGYLLKTDDSGQTWQLINLQTPDKEIPTGMFFLNNNTGFISGKKLFRKTVDGGQTWSEVINPVSEHIFDIRFKDVKEGYATSENGKYYKSNDGGKTWQPKQANTDDHLRRIYLTGSKSLAKCRTNVFIDLATGNQFFTVPESAFNFLFLNDSRCIGIGQHYEGGFLPYGDVFLTNDAWTTFSQKKYNPQSEAMNVTAISKAEDGKVIIIGCGTINTSVMLLRY